MNMILPCVPMCVWSWWMPVWWCLRHVVWSFLVHLWSCLGGFPLISWFLVTPWFSGGLTRFSLVFGGFHAFGWFSMVFSSFSWVSLTFGGCPWLSSICNVFYCIFCGFPWFLGGCPWLLGGFPWVWVGFHFSL